MKYRLVSPVKLVVRSTALVLMAATAAAVVVLSPQPSDAADAAQFDPGMIISDEVFYDSGAMSVPEIAAFLNEKGSKCVSNATPCLKDLVVSMQAYSANSNCAAIPAATGLSAADVFYQVGRACSINPQVLLVLVEKEQSLVTRAKPDANAYLKTAGYDCPDSGSCNPAMAGFVVQLYNAAWQYQQYKADPKRYKYQAGRTNRILYQDPKLDPSGACGYGDVYIANQATAGLYNYTPYQPNSAALANLYGTGDSCSSYGNRNFWRLFTDWFSNPGNLLVAPGFEASAARWGFANGALDRLIIGPTSDAKTGNYFLSMYAGTPYRSLSQDVTVNAEAGSAFEGSIWVRSDSPGKTFNGQLAIWGLGGRNENVVVPFSVGNEWTQVTATLDTTQLTRTVRLEVYLVSTDALLGLDTTELKATTPRPRTQSVAMQSPSFEQGLGTWGFTNGFMNRQLYQFGADAHDGQWILATNTAVPNHSLKQDVPFAARVGETYATTVWMRSSNPGVPAVGTLALWAMGPSTEAGATPFSVGDTWTPVSASVTVTKPGVHTLRHEIYLQSTDTTLFLDDASIDLSLIAPAGFDSGTTIWSSGVSGNALTSVGASSGRSPLLGTTFATTTGPFTSGSIATDVSYQARTGETYEATVWVRSGTPGTPFTGTLALWALPAAQQVATAPISVGDQWTPVTVTLTNASVHDNLRVEIYAGGSGAALDLGEATLIRTAG